MLELAYLFGMSDGVTSSPALGAVRALEGSVCCGGLGGYGMLCSSHFPGVGKQAFPIRCRQQALPPANPCPEVMGSAGQGEEP